MSTSDKKPTAPRQTPPFHISKHDFFVETRQDVDHYCEQWGAEDMCINDYPPEAEEADRLKAEADANKAVTDADRNTTHYIESKISDPPF